MNDTLKVLRLAHNSGIGDAGVRQLISTLTGSDERKIVGAMLLTEIDVSNSSASEGVSATLLRLLDARAAG